MLFIACSVCTQDLGEPGAVLTSPPLDGEADGPVQKFHICTKCWAEHFVQGKDWKADFATRIMEIFSGANTQSDTPEEHADTAFWGG